MVPNMHLTDTGQCFPMYWYEAVGEQAATAQSTMFDTQNQPDADGCVRRDSVTDWAISFKEGAVKHIYFVAETKGSISSMDLREIEKTKIKCARKFFDEMNRRFAPENVKYDVVDSFGKLMEVVK